MVTKTATNGIKDIGAEHRSLTLENHAWIKEQKFRYHRIIGKPLQQLKVEFKLHQKLA